MPEYLPVQRWWYEEAYSLLRLERAILGLRLDGFLIVPGAIKGALAVVRQRLNELRWLSWDAVALAERSLVFSEQPVMVTSRYYFRESSLSALGFWWDGIYRRYPNVADYPPYAEKFGKGRTFGACQGR